ncbi:hypothetical protein PHJA_002495600 [Phtheirospermum japonicum]|uniref:Uncharacterized protein n=1 Tax=Phtheirospermum japonicum TaxID=374723 RepID=A0A830CSH7_9LAMI|nr:hypothetical protein PHJA_002495600 [Phtheirospermum japonicum]
MQVNLQMQGANNGESEQVSSTSDDGQFVVALRKMMEREMKVMVIRTFEQEIGPIMKDLVKEEIQSAHEKFLTCAIWNQANEATKPRERSLTLKFLDEISGPVLTGKAIEGKGGTHVRVALVDKKTGQVVNCGPESSAKVEILVLDASGDDNGQHSLSVEDFNRRIIRESDKKKPHFPKSNYIYLDKGVAVLHNAKLGHDSNWMKSCRCRLGAIIVGNFGGINVEEASTESFMVLDSRSNLYKKHHPPSLSDLVWRLENIGKDGPRCERLNNKNVFTVRDFLFLLSIDPKRLQEIVSAGAKWKATVDHARTCVIDDKRIYLFYPSPDIKTSVAFDVVGGLKGLIHESLYVPVNNLSAHEKDHADKLLLSAFENPNDITSFDDENSLLRQFPLRPSHIDVATNSGSDGSDLIIPENINGHDSTEPGPSSQSINPYHDGPTSPGQLYDDVDPYMVVPPDPTLSPQFFDLDHLLLEYGFGDETLRSLFLPETNNHLSENLLNSREHLGNAGRTNLIGVAAVMLRVVQASKRFLALGGVHVRKRQRILPVT